MAEEKEWQEHLNQRNCKNEGFSVTHASAS